MKPLVLIMCLITTIAQAKNARTVHMTDKRTEAIYIPVGKTAILSFPTKPTKVILGNQGLFGVEYVEQDLAISPLKMGAHSNLFVYLEGRRFGFDLKASSSDAGDEIILVRDAEEKKLKVKVRNE
jgi:hypothetical protein